MSAAHWPLEARDERRRGGASPPGGPPEDENAALAGGALTRTQSSNSIRPAVRQRQGRPRRPFPDEDFRRLILAGKLAEYFGIELEETRQEAAA